MFFQTIGVQFMGLFFQKIGVQYMGLCCGNQAHYTRVMSESLGRRPPATKYSPDMTQHFTQVKGKYSTMTEVFKADERQ